MRFADRVADLVEPWWDEEANDPSLGHRALMRLVATAVALEAVRPGARSAERLAAAVGLVERLAALQGADGLFSSDGNLHSPPDSAFTLNDVGVGLGLLERVAAPEAIGRGLRAIAAAAAPALVAGGVHTPNHRWEISAALVRLRGFHEGALARAEQWLAEGVDVDADGLYSERSANYAAFVSNPCLLAIAEGLGRPDLEEVVHRNLHAQLDLTDADGAVETVLSRRQDQKPGHTVPLDAFHTQLRRFAQRGCEACAEGARRSEPRTGHLAAIALLELAADPDLGGDHPAIGPVGRAPVQRHFASVGLIVAESARTRTIVYGGSDVPHVGRVGSGLAGNPTFLRFRSGCAVVRSLRLSRVFFGLGPFRAERLVVDADGVAHLRESLAARYYQPLPAALRRDDGRYRIDDDGRFHASMAFADRAHDDVDLTTDIEVRTSPRGVDVHVVSSGVDTRWSLEIAVGEGDLTGVETLGPDTYRMAGSRAELRNGSDAVVIETSVSPDEASAGWYDPGEAYTFLGGTDALAGPRLYLTGATPGTWTLSFRSA